MPYWKPAIPDESLDPFDEGMGVLTRDGAVVGHVATIRSQFHGLLLRRRQWWIWYVVVWSDGARERSQEDYPPWSAVREMQAGYLDVDTGRDSRTGRYGFAWLSPVDAAAARERLGIRDSDF
ncbi:hypothetical protein BFL34_02282 [Clavibacter michiganensis]|uniref:Uncharacterized protein n=1 Tax=Clavibacter michiganensis TaxID=28447 RepID=A0A251Y4N0_9MICO|nr:hypothetical protein [Clavibacter michiganensis]OUE19240.1 hypothetical protein BFL34_02282 [Clavibacter michiganensis]